MTVYHLSLNCFKNKRYATIHDILFYWCDDEQRMSLEKNIILALFMKNMLADKEHFLYN